MKLVLCLWSSKLSATGSNAIIFAMFLEFRTMKIVNVPFFIMFLNVELYLIIVNATIFWQVRRLLHEGMDVSVAAQNRMVLLLSILQPRVTKSYR